MWNRRTVPAILFLAGAVGTALAQAPPQYTVKAVAGNGTSGFSGDGSTATSGQFAGPFGIATDGSGNLYIADQVNNRIRRLGADGTISTVAGDGTQGYAGDGATAAKAQMSTPVGLAVDKSGNIYVAEMDSHVIRRFTNGGNISTFAGKAENGATWAGDGAVATAAGLNRPRGVAIDPGGLVYIADSGNHRIRKVDSSGNISTFAGNGTIGYYGDGSAAIAATFNNPQGMAFDAAGNLYVADTNNHVIRKITKDGSLITTVAGTGRYGYSGDGGLATGATLAYPTTIALDAAGNLFIADTSNSRIRVVLTNGVIWTVAGTGGFGDGADGPATSSALKFPLGVALDSTGAIWVSDTQNNRIKKLTPVAGTSNLPVISLNGVGQSSSFGAFRSISPGAWVEIFGTNFGARERQWAGGDFSGNTAPTSLDGVSVSLAGSPAFVAYVSPTQINALIPRGVCLGLCQMTVTTPVGTSSQFTVNVKDSQPGLLAPPAFRVGGRQYVGAIASDGVSYVLPPQGAEGVQSRPARPGETIAMYGIGFGPVSPFVEYGDRATGATELAGALTVMFGNTAARVVYAGMSPGTVGLYQFNVVVPDLPDNDAVPVTFTLDGAAGTQTLFTAVRR